MTVTKSTWIIEASSAEACRSFFFFFYFPPPQSQQRDGMAFVEYGMADSASPNFSFSQRNVTCLVAAGTWFSCPACVWRGLRGHFPASPALPRCNSADLSLPLGKGVPVVRSFGA